MPSSLRNRQHLTDANRVGGQLIYALEFRNRGFEFGGNSGKGVARNHGVVLLSNGWRVWCGLCPFLSPAIVVACGAKSSILWRGGKVLPRAQNFLA